MKCPFCNRKFDNSLFGDERYEYCFHCTLAKRKSLPTVEYGKEYYAPSSTFARKLFIPIETFFYILRTGYVGLQKRNIWIDVGAGDGGYLQTVPAAKKIGVEISKAARARMRARGIEAISDQDFLRMKNGKANVISFWHVLEHMDMPWRYVAKAYENLADDGRIVVAVPNIDSFEFQLFRDKWFHLVPQYHLWHFTPKSIEALLRREGFRIRTTDFWCLEHHPTGILQTFINAASGTDAALQKLVKRADGAQSMNMRAGCWSIFWLTVGLPVVIVFWLAQVALRRSGTLVIVASKSRSTKHKIRG